MTTTSIQTIADVASSARHAAEIASMAVSSGLLQITRPEQAVLLILRGADLGMTPMQSLYAFHVINNRPSLSSDAMVALIRRSGLCESWHIVESTATRCTIATKRVGDIEATSITWTFEDAARAGLPMRNSNWKTYPAQMLRKRVASDLARAVYPDVILNIYTPEEITESADVPVVADAATRPTTPAPGYALPSRGNVDARPELPPPPVTDSLAAALVDVSSEQPASLRSLAATVDAEPAADDATRAAGERATLRLALLEQVSRCKTPGAVADLWVASKTERDTLTEDDVKVVWKASVNRVKEHQRSTDAGAKSWLKKAVAERTPPDDGTNGTTKPRNGRDTTATGNGAANDSARADGAVACVRDPLPMTAGELRRHLATKTCVTALENSLRAHRDELTADACALYAQRYADLWAAMPDHAGGTLHPRSARAWVDGVLAQAARGERRAA